MKIDLVGKLLNWDAPKGEGIVREVFYDAKKHFLSYSGSLPKGTLEVTDAPHVYVVIKTGPNNYIEVTPAILYRSGNFALMGFRDQSWNAGHWLDALAAPLKNLVLSHVYDGEEPRVLVQPSAALDVIALREAAERGEPMRAEDTLALLDMNEQNFRVAVELSDRLSADTIPVTLEYLLGRKVRIKPSADLYHWYWKYRAEVTEARDLSLTGRISQANDEREGEWWCFVTFEGRNGHWLPLSDLDISAPHR